MTEETVQLSEREREILKLVATGATNQQIAGDLGISINTVKVHLRNIFGKIGAASRTEATLYAMRAGLVEVSQVNGAVAPPSVPAPAPPAQPEPPPAAQVAAPRPGFLSRHRLAIGGALGLLLVVLLVILIPQIAIPGAPGSGTTTAPTPEPQVLISTQTFNWIARRNLESVQSGAATASFEGRIFVIGGRTGEGVTGRNWRYDPTSDTWASLSVKPTAVGDVQAAIVNGKIYVPGGVRADGTVSDAVELYDPARDTWSTAAPLPSPRSAYGLAAVEGRLYLFGGWDGQQQRAEVFAYDPAADSWSEVPPMSAPRAYCVAVAVEGKVYVLGGENASGPLATNEQFSPSAGAQPWSTRAPLPAPRSRFGAGAINNNIFVLGGDLGDGPLYYDVRTDSWASVTPPASSLGLQPAVAPRDASLFVMSGELNRPSSVVYEMRMMYTVTLPSN